MGDGITTCLLGSLMLESHKLAKSPQLWHQERVQQQPRRGKNLSNNLPHLSECSKSEAASGGAPAVSHIYQIASLPDRGQINQATWTTPSQL